LLEDELGHARKRNFGTLRKIVKRERGIAEMKKKKNKGVKH